ncbi:Ypt/Rab-GAP domain of gyp1p superfamily protein [Arabidopsis thaliana]|uniref:Ypt/Rab-GAP domain of gyp1p superfamily protein n=1 Tax=Arabidopsis thaliana TaxID=3702 RepID=F4JTS7_ARATH|nr:Ypt/Rab-GAP domain of gyp1p superfamily protein [Arabidopsis thaliana]AEE83319.1 Ypt/Rab-GAP domain of gyp1p superfamily protein [Arabidopsis thaliana]|eukprot:NP_974542.1 Ypt/Rab-GAP domain of gyp1p superfamily protein [Arabidopsis thaliana]
MAKKGIPEWLNSSLWSSSPPIDDRHLRNPAATSITPPSPPIVERPPFSSSPSAISTAPAPPLPVRPPSKSEINDLQNGSGNDGAGIETPAVSSVEDVSRKAQVVAELSKKVIDLKELRKIASQGLPDDAGIRSIVWKLLLDYLSPDRSLWSSELAKKRSQYKQFKEELLMNPSEVTRKMDKSKGGDSNDPKIESPGALSRSEITHEDHPLSLGTTSLWNNFFKDTEVLEQIERDVMRTHPDMHFFSGDSAVAKSNQDALKNILTIFAKLNPGIRYVQGMNEILAPIFYIFKNDPDKGNAAYAESDAFFCFVELMSGFRDNFCQQLDNSVVGIRYTITRLSLLLKHHDEELWRHLEVTTKINPQFYAFRWITLLLTQEFNFVESLHIWDTLLSDPEGPQVVFSLLLFSF